MDKEITEHIIEIAALAGILVVGWLIGLPVRRRAAHAPTVPLVFLSPLVTPLAVLLLSAALLLLRPWLPDIAILGNDKLLGDWLAIWGGIVSLALLESHERNAA